MSGIFKVIKLAHYDQHQTIKQIRYLLYHKEFLETSHHLLQLFTLYECYHHYWRKRLIHM